MKKIMLFLAATCLFGAAKAQIYNGDFEQLNADGTLRNWGSTFLLYATLDSTGNMTDSLVFDNGYFYAPTNDAANGNHALVLSNAEYSVSGIKVAGRVSVDDDSVFTAWGATDIVPFSTSTKPKSFDFDYKFLPQNGDSAAVSIYIYDINGNASGSAWTMIFGEQNTYTHISVPICYSSNNFPANLFTSYSILFENFYTVTPFSTDRTPSMGTRFYIDNVALRYNTSTDVEQANASIFSVYPNPTHSQLKINYSGEIQAIVLQDMTGKRLDINQIDAKSLDISNLTNGIYYLTIQTQEGNYSQKFVKN